jgi:hypothetical protein
VDNLHLFESMLFALTRQATLAYTVRAVSETEIAQQRTAFSALLQNLGQASFAEIEQIRRERETVTPETGLTPEVVQRLQNRMAKQQP